MESPGRQDSIASRGKAVTDTTLLHRKINPSFVQNGRVTSQAFKPTSKDSGLLSVYDGDLIAARDSWTHFTVVQGFSSAGVYSVSVAERNQIDLPVRPDPAPFPEHAVIDFTPFSGGQVESKAKKLRAAAAACGWQHQAEPA